MRFLLLLLLIAAGAAHAASGEPLPPEKAFRLSARALDPQTLEVRFDIEPGYYMYRDKFAFEVDPPGAAKLGEPRMPPGKVKDDEFFGKVETYRDRIDIRLPVSGDALPAALTLKVVSQGCADLGVCYPPQEEKATVRLAASGGARDAGGPGSGVAERPGAASPFLAPAAGTAGSGFSAEESRIAGLLASGGFWLVIASFFGFGLALAFTPCVLPMIPILSGIVVGQSGQPNRGRALMLSVVYVLGMAITYAAAGVAAGLSGSMLAAALQTPWVLAGFATVFVLLVLSMFVLYELQLPSALQTWLAERSNHLAGGQLAGVFVMGALSALIVSPCVAPPLAGALLFIAERGEATLGGSALFAMALGMGAPLVGVGASAGAILPKAGPWMDSVRHFFGVVLLGVAIWIVSPVIPVVAQMLAWGTLLVVSAVYLHALDALPPGAPGVRKLWKGVGVIALLAGAALLIGAFSGSRDVLQPLGTLRLGAAGGPAGPAASPVRFERVANVADLDARLASPPGRPVMLDFYADWCVSCKEMEHFTFSDPGVRRRLDQFALLQADVTANSAEDKALLKRFSLFGPPGIIFFDAAGREIKGLRVIGFQNAERFAATLDRVLQ